MTSGDMCRTYDTLSFLTWNVNPKVISLTVNEETEIGASLVVIVEAGELTTILNGVICKLQMAANTGEVFISSFVREFVKI